MLLVLCVMQVEGAHTPEVEPLGRVLGGAGGVGSQQTMAKTLKAVQGQEREMEEERDVTAAEIGRSVREGARGGVMVVRETGEGKMGLGQLLVMALVHVCQ
mmetsp:Transcript_21230/g.42521  ORF Transcript_21230/g.42521 Transcript_21230/m.42521 type:complete len:101 (-) Transcript_21230:357-659(-)